MPTRGPELNAALRGLRRHPAFASASVAARNGRESGRRRKPRPRPARSTTEAPLPQRPRRCSTPRTTANGTTSPRRYGHTRLRNGMMTRMTALSSLTQSAEDHRHVTGDDRRC